MPGSYSPKNPLICEARAARTYNTAGVHADVPSTLRTELHDFGVFSGGFGDVVVIERAALCVRERLIRAHTARFAPVFAPFGGGAQFGSYAFGDTT